MKQTISKRWFSLKSQVHCLVVTDKYFWNTFWSFHFTLYCCIKIICGGVFPPAWFMGAKREAVDEKRPTGYKPENKQICTSIHTSAWKHSTAYKKSKCDSLKALRNDFARASTYAHARACVWDCIST